MALHLILQFRNDSRREGLHSFDLRDAGFTDTSASGSCQALSGPGASIYLAGPTSSERGDERGSGGEDRGGTSIQTEGPVQGEVAVIDTLRGVLLDDLRD